MMSLSGRIFMDPQPVGARQPELEVALMGHCPGGVDVEFLLNSADILVEIEALGYRAEVEALSAGGALQQDIYGLPIPVRNVRQFFRLFPRCRQATRYRSALAGASAWLPTAVEDFFHQTGDAVELKKCWILCIDEDQQQEGFLPSHLDDWLSPHSASPFARALMLPRVGLLLMPDLERLQIPAQLDDIPRLRIANPPVAFRPCSTVYDDSHRERRHSDEVPRQPEPRAFGSLLSPIVRSLTLRRPDIHFIVSLPFDAQHSAEQLQPSTAALGDIASLQQSQLKSELHRLQIIYPYLRDRRQMLSSAGALLASAMASVSERLGPWRSIAGRPLSSVYRTYPELNQQQLRTLRNIHDIGVVHSRRNTVQLDDERVVGGVFGETAEYAKSGEISRFLGWLRRELETWGTQLLFEVDPQDPRPTITLRAFFAALFQRGALRGRLPEDAFSIAQINSADNALIFDIAIAPAFPIDRIRLSLSYDKVELRHA